MDESFQFSEPVVVEPPLELERSGQGIRLRISKTDIPYASLTARSNRAYSWTEQDYDANGVNANSVQPNSGNATVFPAYELSGSTTVAANSSVVVPLWLGPTGLFYLFSAPASGSSSSLIVETADGTTLVINPCTMIKIGAGIVLSQPSAGVAQLTVKTTNVDVLTPDTTCVDGAYTPVSVTIKAVDLT